MLWAMAVPPDLVTLPKAEVHVHLEGTVRAATLEDFSARTGISVPRSFSNLNSFVDAFSFAWRTMTSPGDYARLTREYCEDVSRSGVRYAELELAVIGRSYDCLAEAIEAASKQRDVVVRFIPSIPRDFPIEVAWASLEAAEGVEEVVALGLGGREDGNPPERFEEVFAEARRRGLHSAPHAGEDAGPESVRGALDALKAERIQHGVRAAADASLVSNLAERRIPLAVCPTSNLRLGVVSSLDKHPLRLLWDAGVLVSVNTDDPGFFDCDLLGEYAIADRLLGLDRSGYGRLALNAVESSFAPDTLKAELRSSINDWVAKGD
jgi:adenosine deaminase